MRYFTIAALAAVLSVFAVSGTAFAHKVNVFAYAEGGKVHAEGYFADGGRCAGCRVVVKDMRGVIITEGVTDGNGAFSFDIPKAGDIKVVLEAGTGHRGEYALKESEMKAAREQVSRTDKAPVKEAGTCPLTPAAPVACSDVEGIRDVVEEAVEVKLKPVYAMLADMKEAQSKPSLMGIIGGVGYIAGLMGVVMYMKSRKA